MFRRSGKTAAKPAFFLNDETRALSFDFAPGAVLNDVTPPGYRRLQRATVVGIAADFERLGALVLDWQVQRRSGIAVRTPEGAEAPPVTEGFEGAVVVPVGPGRVVAPMRVTRVLRERDVIGFAYGTLPGHPEVGEEAFLVRRVGRETVFELRALSRPAFPYSLVAPMGLALQAMFTERYLLALVTGR